MQRLTKYRLLVGTCALVAVFAVVYAFATQRGTNELRAQLASETRKAAESSARAASAAAVAAQLQKKLEARGDDSKSSAVISAFATQAAACLTVKDQLHIKD